jgi:hypothetical protein
MRMRKFGVWKCYRDWSSFEDFSSLFLHFCVFIIMIITISFMQGIYTYIPETNHIPKEYNVAAMFSLLFIVPISLAPALALMYVLLHQHFPKYVCSAQYGSLM